MIEPHLPHSILSAQEVVGTQGSYCLLFFACFKIVLVITDASTGSQSDTRPPSSQPAARRCPWHHQSACFATQMPRSWRVHGSGRLGQNTRVSAGRGTQVRQPIGCCAYPATERRGPPTCVAKTATQSRGATCSCSSVSARARTACSRVTFSPRRHHPSFEERWRRLGAPRKRNVPRRQHHRRQHHRRQHQRHPRWRPQQRSQQQRCPLQGHGPQMHPRTIRSFVMPQLSQTHTSASEMLQRGLPRSWESTEFPSCPRSCNGAVCVAREKHRHLLWWMSVRQLMPFASSPDVGRKVRGVTGRLPHASTWSPFRCLSARKGGLSTSSRIRVTAALVSSRSHTNVSGCTCYTQLRTPMWCTRGTCVEIATRSCCTASLYRSPRMSIRVMERMCCKRLRAGETARRGASRHCDDVGLHTHQNLAEAPPPPCQVHFRCGGG